MSLVCPRCREPLSDEAPICPAHDLHGVTASALTRAEDAPLLGYVIDNRFALIDFVGGGGMGAVYKGKQLSIGRMVAIKVLHASLTATREDRRRFEDEAKAISLLQSPHTVTLYDFGLVREGPLCNLAYMVLEFVEGETLTQRIRSQGPLPAPTVVGILEGLADALDEAHAHGIVHRDLKPANLLLSFDHRGIPQVKVIDFGVARMGDASQLTQTGFSVGTPSYMAPEQFDAAGSDAIDGRADVYALGVVTYLMFTGRKPFVSTNVLELGRMHRQEPPPALPGSDTEPRWALVQRVIHRALAKRPANRFSTVGSFARALKTALDGVEPSFSNVAVPVAVPVGAVRATAEDFPTPTESFVGMLDEPPARPRRAWLPLVLTVAIGSIIGAVVALSLISGDDPPAPADRQPVIASVNVGGAPRAGAAQDPGRQAASSSQAPPSQAPLSQAPPSQAPLSQAPPSRIAQPRTAQPRTAAPVQPRTTAAPQPKSRAPRSRAPVQPDARVPKTRSAVIAALNRCDCRAARATLKTLSGLRGGTRPARRLRGKVSGCVAPDVDEICVNGKVKPQ